MCYRTALLLLMGGATVPTWGRSGATSDWCGTTEFAGWWSNAVVLAEGGRAVGDAGRFVFLCTSRRLK